MSPSNDLSRAIVLYVGYGLLAYPREKKERVIDYFGLPYGELLFKRVDAAMNVMNSIEIDWTHQSLESASEYAVSEVSSKFPGLNGDAREALRWVFTWWNR